MLKFELEVTYVFEMYYQKFSTARWVAVVPCSQGTGNKLSDLSVSSPQSDIDATLKLSGERSISPVVDG